MEPENPLPCLQEKATRPCLEPVESRSQLHNLFFITCSMPSNFLCYAVPHNRRVLCCLKTSVFISYYSRYSTGDLGGYMSTNAITGAVSHVAMSQTWFRELNSVAAQSSYPFSTYSIHRKRCSQEFLILQIRRVTMSHLLQQSITLYFVFMCFVWFSQ
jgi:hypothetical protein